MKNNGPLQECFSCEHCSCLQPALFILFSCYFTLLLFLLQFFVSSHFVLVIAFSFSFFGNFIYTEHLYKPQFVQTCNHFTFGNRRWAAVSPLFPPFSYFLSFSLPFSATKHSFEDDNSEDGWLDLFLLEEEGCWLGFGGNSRFSVFNARIYGYLCSISLNLGLNLLSTPSITCI